MGTVDGKPKALKLSDRYELCPLALSERQGTACPRPRHRPGGAATCPGVGPQCNGERQGRPVIGWSCLPV
jgi:hypothetical protein